MKEFKIKDISKRLRQHHVAPLKSVDSSEANLHQFQSKNEIFSNTPPNYNETSKRENLSSESGINPATISKIPTNNENQEAKNVVLNNSNQIKKESKEAAVNYTPEKKN